jgi:hypothetical protein
MALYSDTTLVGSGNGTSNRKEQTPMRSCLIGVAMFVCAGTTPALANIMLTLTFPAERSGFTGTFYPESSFSFTVPEIPPFMCDDDHQLFRSSACGYTFGSIPDTTISFPGDFTGATLNGLQITNVAVEIFPVNGVNYARLYSYESYGDSVTVGALVGFNNFFISLGLSSNLVAGTFITALPGPDRFESLGCSAVGYCGAVNVDINGGLQASTLSILNDGIPEPASLLCTLGGLWALAVLAAFNKVTDSTRAVRRRREVLI